MIPSNSVVFSQSKRQSQVLSGRSAKCLHPLARKDGRETPTKTPTYVRLEADFLIISYKLHQVPQFWFASLFNSISFALVTTKFKMPTVTSKLAEELKGSLPASVVVVTPQSEKYEESIKRWSAAAEKPAVRFPPHSCIMEADSITVRAS
jgi:hypothetical protein